MKTLRELRLKKSYDSDIDNILHEFYVPVLSQSIQYLRLTGFFSSTSLALAAKGISRLISNSGIMKLITGVRFQERDIEAIKKAYLNPEHVIEDIMLKNLKFIENKFVEDHVRALGWMVANGKLMIKVAVVYDQEGYPVNNNRVKGFGIFHQKVGIFEDKEGNQISFSGSENESAAGWLSNIEEFKVFRSWEDAEKDYLKADISKFLKFWNNNSMRVTVMDIPEAVKAKLIEIAPDDIKVLDLERWLNTIQMRGYQKKAVNNWLKNSKQGIFEMATGTGKTITAIGCLKTLIESEAFPITIISSPFIHLSKQWITECNKFSFEFDKIIADSSQRRWKDKLVDALLDHELGIRERLIILTTHTTFSSKDFINIIQQHKHRNLNHKLFLIVDEVHGIGAPKRKTGLIEEYDYRLGLSATPKRWFDVEGTDIVFDYFNDVVFEFSLRESIAAGYLTPYIYKPYFTTLTPAELEQYERETKKIAKAYHLSQEETEKRDLFTLLCIKRQKIIRNAKNKLTVLERILDDIGIVQHCLVYCAPQQIRDVQAILNKRNVIQHKFTQVEGTKPKARFEWMSERQFLINKFADGYYQALVSMKCLDEGVDIPPAQKAIMMASSGNPKEFIQRRGRVLRHYPGKINSDIYDIIVEPTFKNIKLDELRKLEQRIVLKELSRYKEFAETAQNFEECNNVLIKLQEKYSLG